MTDGLARLRGGYFDGELARVRWDEGEGLYRAFFERHVPLMDEFEDARDGSILVAEGEFAWVSE